MNEYYQEELIVQCPYCGEAIRPLIDYSAGTQEYFEDCSVCCAPILFSLTDKDADGILQVEVRRDDE
jgi:hypothetical protein